VAAKRGIPLSWCKSSAPRITCAPPAHRVAVCGCALHSKAVCCSVLQCVAVSLAEDTNGAPPCSSAHIFSTLFLPHPLPPLFSSSHLQSSHAKSAADKLSCVAVGCSELQRVAACCSMLPCAAVSCSVLQCAVVCCSVLQCAAVCFSGSPPPSLRGCNARFAAVSVGVFVTILARKLSRSSSLLLERGCTHRRIGKERGR